MWKITEEKCQVPRGSNTIKNMIISNLSSLDTLKVYQNGEKAVDKMCHKIIKFQGNWLIKYQLLTQRTFYGN